MKKLSILLLTLFVLSSCTDESETDIPTADEASVVINETADQASVDIIDLIESDGVESIETALDFLFDSSEFNDIGISRDNERARILGIAKLFGQSPAARASEDDFPKGVYEWDNQEGDFVFIEEAEELILKFPSDDSETNNALFILSELAFDVNELPTDLAATITVDETLMLDIDFRVNWSNDGFPETADIYVFVNPFTFDFNFNDTADKSSTLSASIAKGEEVIAAIDLVAHFKTAIKEIPSDIEGRMEYRDVKIAGSVDFDGADTSENGDPNEFIDLELFVKGDKIGDIIFILENDGTEEYYEAYVEYLDGTSESLEDILEDLLEEFETALDEIG